ncbi:hypothetical protein [Amycolatopsis benzoatilytica]|uniref:hypothetical protein n=1 Tax=Amycolatopsis benzoatilytica TaxID=346045 RepID=UPI000369F8A9|nr:hypothetical protein [Amycolatopsis benzoatilytica]
MNTEPSRARVAVTGALHGIVASLACALVLAGIALAVCNGAHELSLPVLFAIILLTSFLHFWYVLLVAAAGISALAAGAGRPGRAARRVWCTVAPLTLVFPIFAFSFATVQAR